MASSYRASLFSCEASAERALLGANQRTTPKNWVHISAATRSEKAIEPSVVASGLSVAEGIDEEAIGNRLRTAGAEEPRPIAVVVCLNR